MRWLAAGALLLALTPAAAEASPRAAILFLPNGGDAGPLLGELAKRPGMAIGLTSATVGGFTPQQMALDMSQGTRIPTRLYPTTPLYGGDVPPLRVLKAPGPGWQLEGWAAARERAHDAPGDLRPGLLATVLERARMRVVYIGVGGRPTWGAIVAADERGCCAEGEALIGNGDPETFAYLARSMWSRAALLVADLPPGRAGLRVLDALLHARRADDLVYVVQTPAGRKLHLLASGVAGLHGEGELRSATTRQTGLIAATDVAPTVLEHLGLRVPDAMQGQAIEPRGSRDVAGLTDLDERLSVVAGRRGVCLMWIGLVLLALVGLMTVSGHGRTGLRIAVVSALWAPGLMLLTAALAPSRLVEAIVIALGSVALGMASELTLGWPRAPALPVAVVFAAHAVDLAFGSPLIARSIAGPNPAGGARFYGIGNELETILAFSVLFGTGAALTLRAGHRHAPAVFAVAAGVAAVVMGAGRLGADVGAVITLAVGGGAAVVAARGGRPSRRALALVVAAPFVALAALIAIDLISGGDAHLTRSVLRAHGGEDVADVLRRRVRAAVSPLGHVGKAVVFAVALAIVGWLAARRERIFAPLASVPGGHHLRAGLIGAFFAVLAGTLGNDSGPLILEIGAVLLILGGVYASAAPVRTDA